jgi:hypothetical protein
MRAQRLRPLGPLVLAVLLAAATFAVAAPAPVSAGTADTMEAAILESINRDRTARGLRPLYRHYKLVDLAGDRAAILASKKVLSHTAAGNLSSQLAATYGVIVFTESVDQTRPSAKVSGSSRSGTTVTWTWTGHDPRLQTHTAGLRDYDVQYRVGTGSWALIRDNTTATSLTLTDRPRGTTVSIRVRATDRRGNIGAWSGEVRVSIP